jgi:hypothetical protein
MNRYTKILLTSLLALMFVVPAASARPRVIIGVGGGFGGFYGPGFYGPGWGPGWYGPAYYYGPYGSYYAPSATMGSVKFDTKAKDAMVYVDGAYAGRVGDLKTFPLKVGEHDVELRDPTGNSFYQEHINVLAGKTLKLTPSNTPNSK